MRNEFCSRKKQGGWSLYTLLAIAVVACAALGAYIALNGSNPTSDTSIGISGYVSKLKTSYGFIKGGFQKAMGVVSTGSITYDNSATTGIFNPNIGGVDNQMMPAQLCAAATSSAPDCLFVFRGANVKGNNVGQAATADYALVSTGLTQAACAQYNMDTYKSATIPASGVTAAAWRSASVTTTAPSDTATAAVDLTGILAVYNWTDGCMSTSDGNYVWFGIILSQ